MFKDVAGFITQQLPVVRDGGEDLPRCGVRRGAGGACSHTQRLVASMTALHGEGWRASCGPESILCTQRSKCPYLEAWGFQAFWQLCDLLDQFVALPELPSSAEGVRMLCGSKRMRRSTWVKCLPEVMHLERTPGSAPVIRKGRGPNGGDRFASDAVQKRMSGYLNMNAERMQTNQFALGYDCSGVGGRSWANFAVENGETNAAMWLSPKAGVQPRLVGATYPNDLRVRRQTTKHKCLISCSVFFFKKKHCRKSAVLYVCYCFL
jgi:hypothetical protein